MALRVQLEWVLLQEAPREYPGTEVPEGTSEVL